MEKGGNATTVGTVSDVKPNVSNHSTVNGNSIGLTKIEQQYKWYNRGGIQGVSEIGMGLNVALVPILFITYFTPDEGTWPFPFEFKEVFLAVLVLNIFSAIYIYKMRTLFVTICCSVYMTSLLALLTLGSPILITGSCIVVLSAWKVAICMSVCLHRYAAHAAFKCGPMLQFVLNLLGSAANQGGPIWWASQHRCHHKYCDVKRDPHSAVMVGTERAFAFFLKYSAVEEEFVPRHNDNWYLRIVDTWCFAVCTAEVLIAYYLFGKEGMLVSYTSAWICQTITLWFNVANHPPDAPGKVCKAHNKRMPPTESYPLFQLLHCLYPFLGFFAGELDHDDHHRHSLLAKRDSTDLGYYLFILPLKALGLVWDVKETRLV